MSGLVLVLVLVLVQMSRLVLELMIMLRLVRQQERKEEEEEEERGQEGKPGRVRIPAQLAQYHEILHRSASFVERDTSIRGTMQRLPKGQEKHEGPSFVVAFFS